MRELQNEQRADDGRAERRGPVRVDRDRQRQRALSPEN
jgi:hypothetical protein